MAIQSSERVTLPYPYGWVFEALRQAAFGHGLSERTVDPHQGLLVLSSSVGLLTWGENVTIRCYAPDATSTVVDISSSLKFGLVDWGKNRQNIDGVIGRLHQILAWWAQQSSPQPPPS